MSALDIAAKGIAAAKAAKAAKRAEPFYSAVDEAAKTLTRGKGTGKEFMVEVLKKPGVKPTEIKERGLQKIEALPKMTKEEFLQKLEENPAPKIEEKVLTTPNEREIEEKAYELAHNESREMAKIQGYRGGDIDDVADEMAEDIMSGSDREEYMQRAQEALYEDGYTAQHGEYTLPRGENYREVLLKVPGFKGEQKLMELEAMRRRVDPKYHSGRYEELTKQIDELKAQKAAMPEQFEGVDMHFKGEPGILASIRVSDRTGPKGEKVLHIEEIQSDWHQHGRDLRNTEIKRLMRDEGLSKKEASAKVPEDFGYKKKMTPEEQAELKALRDKHYEEDGLLEGDMARLRQLEAQQNKVPDAPFKKNWHELALKRMLNYAAENGYDRIAITPGAEQADRYSLAKQINAINYQKNPNGTYSLTAIDKNGKPAVNQSNLTESGLEELIGKDLTKKIISDEGTPFPEGSVSEGMKSLSGLDLEVGGEGMKGFYDQMIPSYLNTYGKKYGVQVTPFDIEKPSATNPNNLTLPGYAAKPVPTVSLHGFDITPEMREEITGKGLPLYQQIGIPAGGAAAGAEALQPEEPSYADGGAVTGPVGSEYDTTPDMQDGGRVLQGTAFKKGGRVHLSQNSDTMLLDLLSKS